MASIQTIVFPFVFLLIANSAIISTTKSSSIWPPSTYSPRTIMFSGYQWSVKSHNKRIGPGLNYFNNSIDSVFIDNNGYLHLKIIKRNGYWISSGLYSVMNLLYGSFSFTVEKGYEKIDPRAVVGLFTYLDDTNQIDVQLSQWGNSSSMNSQYVLQPYEKYGNLNRFNMTNFTDPVIHSFTWTPNYVLFQTFRSGSYKNVQKAVGVHCSGNPLLIREWKYTGTAIPKKEPTKVRINFWLYRGSDKIQQLRKPLTEKEQEIVIRQFNYRNYVSSSIKYQ